MKDFIFIVWIPPFSKFPKMLSSAKNVLLRKICKSKEYKKRENKFSELKKYRR
jgi:hypothetical protein